MDGLRDQCWHSSRWIFVTDNRQPLERWITIASDSILLCVSHELVPCGRLVKYFRMGGTYEALSRRVSFLCKQRQRTCWCEETVHDNLESNVTIACKVRGRAARIQPDHVRDTRQWQTVLCQHKDGDQDVMCTTGSSTSCDNVCALPCSQTCDLLCLLNFVHFALGSPLISAWAQIHSDPQSHEGTT